MLRPSNSRSNANSPRLKLLSRPTHMRNIAHDAVFGTILAFIAREITCVQLAEFFFYHAGSSVAAATNILLRVKISFRDIKSWSTRLRERRGPRTCLSRNMHSI